MLRYKVTAIIFVCFLWIPLLNMVFRVFVDIPATDFRVLAEYPSYGTELHDFPAKFQNFFHDNFSFRNNLIRLNGTVHYSLLKTSTNDEVMIGKEGWLYYNSGNMMDDFHGKIKMKDDEMEQARNYFNELQNFIESKGAKLLIAVCPNPQTIYPEYLPDYEKYNTGNPGLLDQYIGYFKRHNGPDIVDFRPALLDAKRSSDNVLYHSDDTHWNELGAGIAFRELINRINELGISVQIPAYSVQKGAEWKGDLARMIAAETVPKSVLYNFVFPPEVSVQVKSGWEDPIYDQVSNAANGLKVVFLADSYSIPWRYLIGATFSESRIEQSNADIWRIMEEYSPDVVIYEFVERALGNWHTLDWNSGSDMNSVEKISGYFEDGWVSRIGNFRVRTGDLGSITITGYYPGEITSFLTGIIYINDEPNPFAIDRQLFMISILAPKNEKVSMRIENNFVYRHDMIKDPRELCFVITDLYGE